MDTDQDLASLLFSEALVRSLGGSVHLLQCVAVALLVALTALISYKDRSTWSALETVPLSTAYVMHILGLLQLHVSFPVFLLSKLLASTVCFGAEALWRAKSKLTLPQLWYLMGTLQSCWHTGVTEGAKHYNSSFSRNANTTTDDVDSSFELTPQVKAQPPHAHTARTVGMPFGYITTTHATILQHLKQSGRCHNWAGDSVYTLSVDKFTSYSLIAWRRGLNWVGAALFFVFAVQGLPFARAAVDVLAIAFSLLDVVNIRNNQLEANRRRVSLAASTQPLMVKFINWTLSVAFYVTLSSCCPHFLLYLEFHIYLVTSCLLSTYLHFVYFPSRRQMHARAPPGTGTADSAESRS